MIKIVCGLGNPGTPYRHTRHNLGFDVIDHLRSRLIVEEAGGEAGYEFVTGLIGSERVHLMKPLAYVNRSGLAVDQALQRFKAEITELFVICDDFNLPLGKIRIRPSGSSGGHHGLASIIAATDRRDFPRLRAGIGPLPEEAVADRTLIPRFVLGQFPAAAAEIAEKMVSLAAAAVVEVITGGLERAIRTYSSANPTPER